MAKENKEDQDYLKKVEYIMRKLDLNHAVSFSSEVITKGMGEDQYYDKIVIRYNKLFKRRKKIVLKRPQRSTFHGTIETIHHSHSPEASNLLTILLQNVPQISY